MKAIGKKSLFIIPIAAVLMLSVLCVCLAPSIAFAATKTTMTRQGDSVWFGYYPQTKATDDELSKMSATPDENGYFTSGKNKFVKVTSANPKFHTETADTDYIPFDDETQPVLGATYYFKLEPIEWNVMVDDEGNNTVKLVSKYYLDTHAWLTQYENAGYWSTFHNTMEGVPENTPANGWRYSEIRAWLNGDFLNTAFTETERKSIYVFANKNTIDYRSNDESTIVNDYIAVGNRADYDAAGDNGRPTDYAIVKGATWCYNKDHIYYWVNDSFQTFGQDTVRLYRHDEHEKCTRVESVEAVRPIMYVKRGDAKILATASQKEEKQSNFLLIFGIIITVIGAAAAVPIMAITSARYKKLPAEQKNGKFPYKKHEVPMIAIGLVLLIGGLLMIFLPIAINGGGIGVSKLKPGIYVQDYTVAQSGNVAFIGKNAYKVNADGTYQFAAVYDGAGSVWDVGGTWSQSGSKVTFKGKANPLYPNGYTVNATVMDGGTSFGNSGQKFKRIS